MRRHPDDENPDDVEFVPIPMDRETIANLARLGRAVGEHPAKLAGALLRDVVKDDAMAHAGIDPTSLN